MGLPLLESIVVQSDAKRDALLLLQKLLEQHHLSDQFIVVPLCLDKNMQSAAQDLRRELHNVAGALTSVPLIVRLIEDKLSKTDPSDQMRLEQIKKHAEVINQVKRGFIDPLFRQLIQQLEQA